MDGHTVTIHLGSRRERITYAEMGMKNANTGEPNKLWKLLQAFAAQDGRFDWQNSEASPQVKQQVSRLRRVLKAYFGLDTDPFYDYQKGAGYRVKFALKLER